MKKIFLTMTAVAALAAAIPTAAQGVRQSGYGGGVENRIERLEMRLEAGIREGSITRREAWPLRAGLTRLAQLERRYSANGLTAWERNDLQQRIRTLRQQINVADGGASGRYDRDDGFGLDIRLGGGRNRPPLDPRHDANRDGWDDRDRNRDGRRDLDISRDRNQDGWDDHDLDRDGRWDVDPRNDRNRDGFDDRDRDKDGVWQEDGPVRRNARDANGDGRWDVDPRNDRNRDGWDDRDEDRDGVWSENRNDSRYYYGDDRRDDDNGDDRDDDDDDRRGDDGGDWGRGPDGASTGATLRVGQRASANLTALSVRQRARYRDTGDVYYRSDGRSIYQINARTHMVAAVYPIGR